MPITVLYLFHSPESKSCGGVQSRASPLFCLGRARKRLVSGIPVQSRKPPPGPPFGRRLRVLPLGEWRQTSPKNIPGPSISPTPGITHPRVRRAKRERCQNDPKREDCSPLRVWVTGSMGNRVFVQPGHLQPCLRATGLREKCCSENPGTPGSPPGKNTV